MSKFCCQIFLLILTFTVNHVNSMGGGKIKGGRAARSGEFPFIGHLLGSLYGDQAKVCGCALVTVTKVVTAAHCVIIWNDGPIRTINVAKSSIYFGTLYLLADDAQIVPLKSVKYPKELRKRKYGGLMHDYATAELARKVQLTDRVKPIALYSTDKTEFKNGWDEMVASGARCTVIGWGSVSYQVQNNTIITQGPNQFLKTTLAQPWEEQKCQDISGSPRENMVPFGQVCLVGVTRGETVLPGDSGGPLLCGAYVWGVATSMTVDPTGSKPMYYLLHWHYLNEYLFPNSGKKKGSWFGGWFGGGGGDKGGGSGGDAGDGAGGGSDGGGASRSSCPEISFTLLLLILLLV